MTSRSLTHPFSGRPGYTVRRRVAWPRVREFLNGRRGIGLTATVAGTTLFVALCLWVAGIRGVWLGLLIGIVFATFVTTVAWLVAEHSGARSALIGASGERFSAEAFRQLSKRWIEIDSVPFERFDVDHVLISESGVFAVETKFTSVQWSERSTAYANALVDARQRARKIKLLLAGTGKPAVMPVLVIWGPGAPAIPGGFETVGDVLGCRGSSPKAWIAHLEGLPHTFERGTVQEMAAVVDERVRVAASHG
jgi:hypothetical protein